MPDSSDDFRSGFVTLYGRPNTGKSTLLNRILRSKVSITSNKAQTTRHQIRGVLTDDDVTLTAPGSIVDGNPDDDGFGLADPADVTGKNITLLAKTGDPLSAGPRMRCSPWQSVHTGASRMPSAAAWP